jgi:hypothetical protein
VILFNDPREVPLSQGLDPHALAELIRPAADAHLAAGVFANQEGRPHAI